ncbi:hypothetical protein [Aquipluma nitroreducens]|nr:hypothetical protein [Aquipluma nitroreducens]
MAKTVPFLCLLKAMVTIFYLRVIISSAVKNMFTISQKEYPISVLKHGISIKSLQFLLENLKNIVSFTRFFKEDMYKSPLYGKEWNWRNIKMETRELNIDLRL